MNTDLLVVWMTVIATLGVYTILYRENAVSRLFEHVFVGLAAGYLIVITWTENLEEKWWVPMVHQGHWYWAFAPVVGLMFYFIYTRRLLWMARVVMGLFFGSTAGQFFRQFYPIYGPQITDSFKPLGPEAAASGFQGLWRPVRWIGPWGDAALHNWIFIIILFTVLSYFIFSVPHEKGVGRLLGRTSLAGRWFLMIAFGAMFASTAMARLSLFIGRVQFLLFNWLGHYVPWLAHRG